MHASSENSRCSHPRITKVKELFVFVCLSVFVCMCADIGVKGQNHIHFLNQTVVFPTPSSLEGPVGQEGLVASGVRVLMCLARRVVSCLGEQSGRRPRSRRGRRHWV